MLDCMELAKQSAKTPTYRLAAIAVLLAQAVIARRIRPTRPTFAIPPAKRLSESAARGLEVCRKTRLSVHSG
jgi:hypothetical protein